MNNKRYIILSIILITSVFSRAQECDIPFCDTLKFKGQVSSYIHYNPSNTLPFYIGGRYIPQLNYEMNFAENNKIDFEASANIFGNAGYEPFDTSGYDGKLKPYRTWARYSTNQFEFRVGLQKINFGSASMLRPLMWFDQIDPRDPLRLTDGVWGALGRYYFLNNANIWLWCLYGNDKPKGWEIAGSSKDIPEFGGRFQSPIPRGEAAVSYHNRLVDTLFGFKEIRENRIGFDAKLDLVVGLWVEGVWINNNENLGAFSNQEIINIGTDYTFGIGNGLTMIYEQLVFSYDNDAFAFSNPASFSILSLSYPVGLFDNVSTILYYDWTNENVYSFVNWQRQYDKFMIYIMGYWNPKNYKIPTQGIGEMLFAGKGVQVMFVFNH